MHSSNFWYTVESGKAPEKISDRSKMDTFTRTLIGIGLAGIALGLGLAAAITGNGIVFSLAVVFLLVSCLVSSPWKGNP